MSVLQIKQYLKELVVVCALLSLACAAMTLDYNYNAADEALKSCGNARYAFDNKKECE